MSRLPRISVEVIPHKEQRYDTIGDWLETPGGRVVYVSDIGDADRQFLVALHALIEQHLCAKAGVLETDVTLFDMVYDGGGEPGDHPDAPYRKQHRFATRIEKLVAKELGVDWDSYGRP